MGVPLMMDLVGLGTYKLNDTKGLRVISEALDIGYRHIDTAAMYGNEEVVGRALAESSVPREEIYVTTKVWPSNFSKRDFIRSAELSLRKLGTEYLDVLLLHWPNPGVPLEETLEALSTLIESGKVHAGGVSNFDAIQMRRAEEICGDDVCVNQVCCHVGNAPAEILQEARGLGISITAYSPLSRGDIMHSRRVVDLAKKYQVTPAQIALRWMTQQGIAVIPKASTSERLKENLASLNFTLAREDLEVLGLL